MTDTIETINPSTPLIRLSDLAYPMYLYNVRQDNPNVSFSNAPAVTSIQAFGYDVVYPVTQPTGDVVTEGAPAKSDVDGKWYQTWNVRNYTPEELAANLQAGKDDSRAQLEVLLSNAMNAGYTYALDASTSFTVTLRLEDRLNLTSFRIIVDAKLQANPSSTETISYRSGEDVTYNLTLQQMRDLTDASFIHAQTVYSEYWAYVDQIKAATTLAELPVLPPALP